MAIPLPEIVLIDKEGETLRRHAVTDEQWGLIEPLLPPAKETGRPRSDPRVIVEGILWILRTGMPWRDLAERLGPWQTVYDWSNRWSKDGTWDRVLESAPCFVAMLFTLSSPCTPISKPVIAVGFQSSTTRRIADAASSNAALAG